MNFSMMHYVISPDTTGSIPELPWFQIHTVIVFCSTSSVKISSLMSMSININQESDATHDWSPLKSPKAITLLVESSPREPALMRELLVNLLEPNGHNALDSPEAKKITHK